MKTMIIAATLAVALFSLPARADTTVCPDAIDPTKVASLGRSHNDLSDNCFKSDVIREKDNDLYTITGTGAGRVVVRKSDAVIATIKAAREAKEKAVKRANDAEQELERKGWTAGELTRRLSGGLAILSRVMIALADGVAPAATDMATLRALQPELARYEISGPNLITTVKQLADARAEVGAAIAADRDPDLHTIKDKDTIKD